MNARNLVAMALLVCGLALRAEEGGTVKGAVIYDGEPPELKPKPVAVGDQGACKCKEVPNEALLVDKATKGIKYSIVRIMIEPKDAPPKAEKLAQMDQQGCKFVPHVVVSAPGESVEFLNGTGKPEGMGLMHNIHTTPYDFLNQPANVAHAPTEPVKTLKGAKHFKEPEIVEVKCDIHPWMKAFVVVHDPRYCAVTAEDGKFEIKNVPPGKYKLNIFQESCGEKIVDIEVKAGAAADVGDVKMKKGK